MGLIVAEHLHKEYDNAESVPALADVTFDVEDGEFVGVVGPSGSGKSTLLTILGGLNQPSTGRLLVDDMDIYALTIENRADFRREYVGFVFQSFQLIPYLTVLENTMLPLAVSRYSNKEQEELAMKMLGKFRLQDKSKRLPDELSGGEQERVAIARALVNQPPIILADEPTGNLDSANSSEIMQLLRSLHEDGHTIILVTHNEENLHYTDRCIALRDGNLDRPYLDKLLSDLTRNDRRLKDAS